MWKSLPEHNIDFVYDTTDGYPAGFDPSNPPAPFKASETAIVSLPSKLTTTVTTDGSREGKWDFAWTVKDANGTDVPISNNQFVMPRSDATVMGKWTFTPNKHKVTFVLDGGTMSSPSVVEVDDGDTVSRPTDTPVKPDKNYFYNWYADDRFEKEFDFDNTQIKADTYIYARYIKYYTIKFDLNGGALKIGSSLELEIQERERLKIPVWNDTDPSGEPIQDWLVPPAGTEYKGVEIDGKFYAPGTYYVVTKDATVKVLYMTKGSTTYSITFDLNGGTMNGKTGRVTIIAEEGSAIILPAPTRKGHTFDYWEGSHYNAGDSYVVKGNHTFTAQWKKNSITPTDDDDNSSSNKDSNGSSPKTGDFNDTVIWNSLICMLTAILFALLMLARRRKYREASRYPGTSRLTVR